MKKLNLVFFLLCAELIVGTLYSSKEQSWEIGNDKPDTPFLVIQPSDNSWVIGENNSNTPFWLMQPSSSSSLVVELPSEVEIDQTLYDSHKTEKKSIIIKDAHSIKMTLSMVEDISMDVYPSSIPLSSSSISGNKPATYLDGYQAICVERMALGPTFDEMVVASFFTEKYKSLKNDQFFINKKITHDEIAKELLDKNDQKDLWNYMQKTGCFKNLESIAALIPWRYPDIVPQEKEKNVLYFSSIHVKNVEGGITHDFGVMKFIIDAFWRQLQNPSYDIPVQTFLIKELQGKNDLLGLLLMNAYIKGSYDDNTNKLKEKLEQSGEKDLTLKNVIITLRTESKGQSTIIFEYEEEAWILKLFQDKEDRKKEPWVLKLSKLSLLNALFESGLKKLKSES